MVSTIGIRDVTALRCSEPLRYKVGGPSKVFAMVVRTGTAWGKVGVFMRIIGAANKRKAPRKQILEAHPNKIV